MRAVTDGQLEHGKLPDPEGQQIEALSQRIAELEHQVNALLNAMAPEIERTES